MTRVSASVGPLASHWLIAKRELSHSRVRVIPARQQERQCGRLGDVPGQVDEANVLGKGGPDPRDSDEQPARLAWIGKLICLLTTVSTSSTILWTLVG